MASRGDDQGRLTDPTHSPYDLGFRGSERSLRFSRQPIDENLRQIQRRRRYELECRIRQSLLEHDSLPPIGLWCKEGEYFLMFGLADGVLVKQYGEGTIGPPTHYTLHGLDGVGYVDAVPNSGGLYD